MTRKLRDLVLGLALGVHLVRSRASTGAWRSDLRTRDGRVGAVPKRAPGPRILVHGVSVGEVHALAPLADALASAPAAPDVVASAATRTGIARALDIHGARRPVVRFPLDLSWMVERFLDSVAPDLVVLGELELWPTFLDACARRGIPACVANGRLSSRSFRGYRAARPVVRGMFARLALVAAQTELYRDRFVTLGVPRERTLVTGSLKWDAARRRPDERAAREIASALGIDRARPLVVAGSTGPGEEEALVRRFLHGRLAWPPGCQLLLAPRSPNRWDEVAGLVDGMPRRSRRGAHHRRSRRGAHHRRSGRDAHCRRPGRVAADRAARPRARGPVAGRAATPRVFLLDTLGELADTYSLADAVFVGRSLDGADRGASTGGSNPIESVALGRPTVIGPRHEHFAGVVADLAREGGIAVSADPMKVIAEWLADPDAARRVARAGGEVARRQAGAAQATADAVLCYLRERT